MDEETRRNIVRLQDIPTWTQLHGENREDFARAPSDFCIEKVMSHAQTIRTNYKVLLRCTTVNLYVVVSLRAEDIINEEQESILITEMNPRKQRATLFQWLTEVPSDRYESFLKVMKDTEQEHVANLLRGSTYESKLPLSEARYERLEKIRPKLMKITRTDTEVLAELRKLKAISETDVDELRAEQVEYAKNLKMISAIMRRSNHAYDCFQEVLRNTLQQEAAEYLSEGEMPAVHLNNNRPALDESLSRAFNDVIRNRKINDPEILNLLSDFKELDIYPARAIPGQSIIIFIYCKKIDNVIKFTQLFNSGRLQDILGVIFNRLLLTIEPQSTEELDSHISLEDDDIVSLEEFTGSQGCVRESQHRPSYLDKLFECDDTTQATEQAITKSFTGIEESQKYAEDPDINKKVSLYGADITLLQVDGIVRSTDASLRSPDEISGAIKTAAGPKLDEVLKTLGGCNRGEATTTSGFNLPAKYIVHTVGTNEDQPEVLERCYKNCLEQMRLKNMRSLAFCISTGTNGHPNDKAVLVALTTVRVWLENMKFENKLDEIDRIIFCLFSEEDVMLYSIWMQIHFPSTYGPKPDSTVIRAHASSEKKVESRSPKKQLRPLPGFIELTTEPDMITLDDDPNTMRAKMPCGHVIGPESMEDYFRDIVNNGKTSIICPAHDCSRVWDNLLVRHVACLSDEEMQELELKQKQIFLQRQKSKKMCPGCKIWCVRVECVGNRVLCPICTAERGKQFYFCWICLNEWKRFRSSVFCGNRVCGEREGQQRVRRLANCPTKRINLCFRCPSIRACPRCELLIEHYQWCVTVHMSCCNCHCEFCFICMQEFKDGKAQCNFLGTCKHAPRQVPKSGSS